MDKREIARRASEARRLLEEPLLVEALDRMEHMAIEELIRLPDDADRARLDCANRIRALRGIRGHLHGIILNADTVLRKPLRVA